MVLFETEVRTVLWTRSLFDSTATTFFAMKEHCLLGRVSWVCGRRAELCFAGVMCDLRSVTCDV